MKSNYTKPKWALYQNNIVVHKHLSDFEQIQNLEQAMGSITSVFNPFTGEVELRQYPPGGIVYNPSIGSDYGNYIMTEHGAMPVRFTQRQLEESNYNLFNHIPPGYEVRQDIHSDNYIIIPRPPRSRPEPEIRRPSLLRRIIDFCWFT